MWLNLGRALMLVVWGLLLTNLVHSLSPKTLSALLYLLLGLTLVMHTLQLLLARTLLGKSRPLGRAGSLRVMLFGVLELIPLRRRLEQDARPSAAPSDATLPRQQQ
ncbi:DUF1145 domain-containing protein [Plesiomonas sp. PI-19]|uniref:DUF1145 domain-containing protein n=1 Tax=Plesiomonas sp. PI-19 TaxID=2898798 RepID=UPI001F1E09E6|nr:DUF1145 domain-containing protein [Plesiomonas sp. PI-19]MCE5164903.1 DUF1145 domain-containing protein [Plesiomonas sp. PI-19]